MADIVTYETGTVEVGEGGTIVYGTGTFWSDWNARGGDDLTIAGKGPVVVVDRLGPNQLKIRPWQHSAMGPGVAYEIVPRAPSRISGLDAFEDYMRVMRAFVEVGFIHNVPAGTMPNPGVGYEGQDAFDHSTGKGWRRTYGVWNYRGKIAGLTFSQEPWSATETYAAGIIVPRGVALYKSLVDGNLNFPPESNPGQWSVYTPGSNVYNGSLTLANGSAATAALGFIGEANTGIIKASPGHIGFTGLGGLIGFVGSSGSHFYGFGHTLGAGGSNGNIAYLTLDGGSAAPGGAHIRFSKAGNVKWYAGITSSLAGGTSDNWHIQTPDFIALTLNSANGSAQFAAAVASTSTTTGAICITNGGLGVNGDVNALKLRAHSQMTTLGGASGNIYSAPVDVSSANLLFYNGGNGNWAGMAADVGGNAWLRVGLANQTQPTMAWLASGESYAINSLVSPKANFGSSPLTPWFAGTVTINSPSNTWASATSFRNYGALYYSDVTTGLAVYFYHTTMANNVGGISITATGTNYGTTSDERKKIFLREYTEDEANAIILADPVREFEWKHTGTKAIGWGAQTSYRVSPDLATAGDDNDDLEPGDHGFEAWTVDQSKRSPYLWTAVAGLLRRVEQLEQQAA